MLFSIAVESQSKAKTSGGKKKRALIVCTYHFNIGVGSFCFESCCNRHVSIALCLACLLCMYRIVVIGLLLIVPSCALFYSLFTVGCVAEESVFQWVPNVFTALNVNVNGDW